ncbi:F-box protein [Phanerochaete sordida]|uniref:F-box protein n=1 Tax=Phanerochaete sordida TaxID=48140 RepID=A0A9P3LAT1_9APHY|nr:F-box protein [Phanerochaete sordida]
MPCSSSTATTVPSACSSLLTIPQELTENVLKFCEPRDLARFAATCRPLRDIVYNDNDQVVWRVSFLSHPFDDPRQALGCARLTSAEVDWAGMLQQWLHAESVLLSRSTVLTAVLNEDNASELGDEDEDKPIRASLLTLLAAYNSALPGREGSSANLQWVESVLLRSALFAHESLLPSPSRAVPAPDSAQQLIAQLQCYLALSNEDGQTKASKARLASLRSSSRCYVYDLRKYRSETLWGPYTLSANGRLRVNWEHVKHIQNVVLMNLRDFPDSWKRVWPSWGVQSVRPYSAPDAEKRKPWDWAGVEGKWRRVVCFMDYRDLFTFNFSSLNEGPLNPRFFDDDFTEAVRLMEVDLKVLDPIDPSSPMSSPDLPTSSRPAAAFFASGSSLFGTSAPSARGDTHPQYPPIRFEGSSKGVHSGTSKIRGTVQMLRDGTVRWNFILCVPTDQVTSYDDAANRWSAEAVQVGHVGSAMGIAGIWTVAVHEEVGDPAGPFWMWKAPDSLPKDLDQLTF